MAIFQGENIKFKIVIKNQEGSVVSTSQIATIKADIYNESNRKVYIQYADDNSNTGILDRVINEDPADPTSGYMLIVYGVDSETIIAGRYIIEIEYTMTDTDFDKDGGQKIYKQNGALFSVKKSI